jgi:hypothetical protein
MPHPNAARTRSGWGLLPGVKPRSQILYGQILYGQILYERNFSDSPSCARSPSDGRGHSTTDGTGPSNAAVQNSDRDGAHLLRGCAHRDRERPGRDWPQLSRLRAGTSTGHRRVLQALQQTKKARLP